MIRAIGISLVFLACMVSTPGANAKIPNLDVRGSLERIAMPQSMHNAEGMTGGDVTQATTRCRARHGARQTCVIDVITTTGKCTDVLRVHIRRGTHGGTQLFEDLSGRIRLTRHWFITTRRTNAGGCVI